jgi:hypothetical protein
MIDARKRVPGSLVYFQSREWNGAFGLAARVGERVAERPEQKVEWSGGFGNSSRERQRGEPSLAGFGGVVFQGEAKAGKSWRRGDHWGQRGPVERFTGWRWNGAEWNRLELAKSGPSSADVSLEAASGNSSAGKGLRGYAVTFSPTATRHKHISRALRR